ncbi:MAG: glycosyltransferase family 39 protein [Chloroflexota bacterium]|nr:glycosyltransferase family 39 protein [Chloroflexota bacterium]
MKKQGALLIPLLEDGAKIILLMFLALAVFIFLTHALMGLFHRYPLDYGEAPLVDQAMRLAAGQSIYRPDISSPPYTISNYPPLYPLSMAPFVKLFGPNFWAGRIISLLSTLASATFLALIVYTYSQDRPATVITGMLFLSIPYVVGWSPLARVDMLALALSTAGLYVVVRWPATWRGLSISALLLVAAIYTRQSYGLAAPLAAFVWLLTQDRRQALRQSLPRAETRGSGQALRLAGLVGGTSLVLFLALNLITRGGFFYNVVAANVNEFDIEMVKRTWRDLWKANSILLIIGGMSLFFAPRRVKTWSLLIPYLIGACLSAATIGKIGSNVNYLLELCAALALTAGALLAWCREHPWLRTLMLILLALQVGQLMKTTLDGPVERMKWRIHPEEELDGLEWIVQTTEGPVLADEFMGMLTLHNRSLYIQPFEVTQLANAGLWDQANLLASIREQEFPLILIHHFMDHPVYKERWTPEMLSVIMENYAATDFLAQTILFRPRDTESGPANLKACPGAPWQMPTRGDMGMWWITYQLAIMAEGGENTVPVYAVADGLLLRRPDWDSGVAIQHDDPVRPGEKVWSFYGDMASGENGASFVVADFAPGSESVPVKAGQLLGYQGTWNGKPGSLTWTHLHFAVVQALENGSFPNKIVGLAPEDDFSPEDIPLIPEEEDMPSRDTEIEFALDPSPYLGTIRSQVMGIPTWLPLRCQKSVP